MSQPIGKKVKEFYVMQLTDITYNGDVVATAWQITKEYHSITDAVQKVKDLVLAGTSLTKLKIVRSVVLSAELGIKV